MLFTGLHCNATTVHTRIPPLINPNPERFASWMPPPADWLFGNWKFTYTSQPLYLADWQNAQVDISPTFPANASLPGQLNDLTSYQPPNSATVATFYVIDTPHRSSNTSLGIEWDAVFDFQGVGAISTINSSWAILAWGYDTCGLPFFVMYQTETASITSSPDLDILSRSDQGPTKETLVEILRSLRALGDEGITALVGQIKPTIQDGKRRGQPPVVCDEACVDNILYGA